jgi:hypothetical protein
LRFAIGTFQQFALGVLLVHLQPNLHDLGGPGIPTDCNTFIAWKMKIDHSQLGEISMGIEFDTSLTLSLYL